MAYIRERKLKNGKTDGLQWQADIRMKDRLTGKLFKKTKTFESKREAEDWALETEAGLRKGNYRDTDLLETTQLKELIQKYIDEVSPLKLGGAREIGRLKVWLKHEIADRYLINITPKDFADHISKRRKEPSTRGGTIAEQTIKHEIIVISNVFESARKDWGYTSLPNPTADISKPAGSQSRDARIVEADWTKIKAELLKCRNKKFVVLSEFAIESGMRQDEIMRMTWDDVDFKSKLIKVEGKDTKNKGRRKKRLVPMSERAIELLKGLVRPIKGDTLVSAGATAWGLSNAFRKAVRDASLNPDIKFHSTRHEAASRLALYYPMVVLMKIFGWDTPATALRYYHADAEALLSGMNKKKSQINE